MGCKLDSRDMSKSADLYLLLKFSNKPWSMGCRMLVVFGGKKEDAKAPSGDCKTSDCGWLEAFSITKTAFLVKPLLYK